MGTKACIIVLVNAIGEEETCKNRLGQGAILVIASGLVLGHLSGWEEVEEQYPMIIGASNNSSLENFGFQRSVGFNDKPCAARLWADKQKNKCKP